MFISKNRIVLKIVKIWNFFYISVSGFSIIYCCLYLLNPAEQAPQPGISFGECYPITSSWYYI